MLARGDMSEGHARAILSLPDDDARRRLARRVVKEGLTVRAAERAAREGGAKRRPRRVAAVDPALVDRARRAAEEGGGRRVSTGRHNWLRRGGRVRPGRQGRRSSRLFHRRELLACDVLDEPQEKRVTIADVAHDSRERRDPRRPSCAPATLARDELEAAFAATPDHDGLEHALEPDRAGKAVGCFGLETTARLAWVGMNCLDGEVHELRLTRLSQQDLEASAEPSPLLRNARQAPSPPSSRPPRRRSGGRRRLQGHHGSGPRQAAPSAGWSS